MNSYHFERQHLIAAYSDEKFVGVFVTYPEETITMEELTDFFYVVNPTCFVAEEIPDLEEELTQDNLMDLLTDMIESYIDTKFSDLSRVGLVYMPRTLH